MELGGAALQSKFSWEVDGKGKERVRETYRRHVYVVPCKIMELDACLQAWSVLPGSLACLTSNAGTSKRCGKKGWRCKIERTFICRAHDRGPDRDPL